MKRLVILAIALVAVLLLIAPMSGCASKEQLSEAYNEGYQVGYNEAYTPAYDEGHTVGYDEGHAVGYDEGHIVGYDEGHIVGYDEGHIVGWGGACLALAQTQEAELYELRLEMIELRRQSETYDDMFFFYYMPLDDQQYGVKNLEKCLDRTWKEGIYQANVFDCSEMSAFLEWYLENEGWQTKIKVGESPDGSGGKHAWLLVECGEGTYMPVEATQWSIVYWDNPYFENYFDASRNFDTIQEALEYSPTGFDWWAS